MSGFGGGFDASDEKTKVAAPPLADLNPRPNTAVVPVATDHQRTDGIGVRQYYAARQVHPLGTWSNGATTDAAPVTVETPHPVWSAGTQPIDISAPIT